MIYVVEIPQEARPRAWFAFDQDDFVRKVRARTWDGVLYAEGSAKALLAAEGLMPDSVEARAALPGIFAAAETFGWETPLFRADYLFEPGAYVAEPVTEFEACVAAVADGLKACRVYLSDQSASNALYSDPIYDVYDGFHAHMALREQLIAMEVISDDL